MLQNDRQKEKVGPGVGPGGEGRISMSRGMEKYSRILGFWGQDRGEGEGW